MPPRDVLSRRVRVAEYYWIPYRPGIENNSYEFYDEGRDSWISFPYVELRNKAELDAGPGHRGAAWNPPARAGPLDFRAQMQFGVIDKQGREVSEADEEVSSYSRLTFMEWTSMRHQERILLFLRSHRAEIIGGTGTSSCVITSYCETSTEREITKLVESNDLAVSITDTMVKAIVPQLTLIGGGLFNDVTASFVPGASIEFPLCDWAALDIHRITSKSTASPEGMFSYGTENTIETIHANLQKKTEDRRYIEFLPFRPNMYTYTLQGGYYNDQVRLDKRLATHVAIMTAAVEFTSEMVSKLWRNVPIEPAMQKQMHDFIVPYRGIDNSKNYEQKLPEVNAARNPFTSVIMAMLMSQCHPDASVRLAALRSLGVDNFIRDMEAFLVKFVTSGSGGAKKTQSALSVEFAGGIPTLGTPRDIEWMELNSMDNYDRDVNPILQIAPDTTWETGDLVRSFAIVAAKRLFCGAERFKGPGNIGAHSCPSVLVWQPYTSVQALQTVEPQNGMRRLPRPSGGSAAERQGRPGYFPQRGAGGLPAQPQRPHSPQPALIPAVPNYIPPQQPNDGGGGGGYGGSGGSGGGYGGSGGGGGGYGHAHGIPHPMHLLVVRPNIEHEMLGMILGRGGSDELGATLWGQTELSCFDDSQHGIWGMSYKYHERAQVFNERNMVRTWDVAFNGYNGGMGSDIVNWLEPNQDVFTSPQHFRNDTEDFTKPYQGASFVVMGFPVNFGGGDALDTKQLPNPLVWYDNTGGGAGLGATMCDPEGVHRVVTSSMRIYTQMDAVQRECYHQYLRHLPDFTGLERLRKTAGAAVVADETSPAGCLAFQGSMRVRSGPNNMLVEETMGSGHLGPSYVGCASVREGKGIQVNTHQPALSRLV